MMQYNLKVNDSTYYFGQNDRIIERFENLYPLPKGMAYNNYLIKDEKNVLIDMVDINVSERFLGQLESALGGEPLHYLIVQHMEPDHAGAIAILKMCYPDLEIVANKKTIKMLEGFHNITTGLVEVDEKSELNIGQRSLHFFFAPMVHWPEVMFTYDPLGKTLFSADAFGSFGTVDGGFFDEDNELQEVYPEMIRYYGNIVGKYGTFTEKAIAKVASLEIKTICPVHGLVWRKHIPEVLELYKKLARYEPEPGVVIVYGSMYGNTDELAEIIARSLVAHGVKRVKMHHMGKDPSTSYVIADVFKYSGVIIGSPTYNNGLWPNVDSALRDIASKGIPNRLYATFFSGAWNPIAEKFIGGYVEKLKWVRVGKPIELLMSPSNETRERAWELGRLMAEAVLKQNNQE